WDVDYEGFAEIGDDEEFAIDAPSEFDRPTITELPVDQVLDAVLAEVGAWPRDTITARNVQEVRDRSGTWGAREDGIDLFAGLEPTDPPADEDRDGMADGWERDHGLDPADGEDHRTVQASGYTAIEEYVNELSDNLVAAAFSAPPAEDVPATDEAAAEADGGDPEEAEEEEPEEPTDEPAEPADGDEVAAVPTVGTGGDGDGGAKTLAIIALLIAIVALGLGAYSVANIRRSQA
ncbi:MAG: hypothetical protein M3527_03210, partial [Actinomycetota bacterium]|nr:hypothetical protein [Actinomycetota bacterium]